MNEHLRTDHLHDFSDMRVSLSGAARGGLLIAAAVCLLAGVRTVESAAVDPAPAVLAYAAR